MSFLIHDLLIQNGDFLVLHSFNCMASPLFSMISHLLPPLFRRKTVRTVSPAPCAATSCVVATWCGAYRASTSSTPRASRAGSALRPPVPWTTPRCCSSCDPGRGSRGSRGSRWDGRCEVHPFIISCGMQ